MCSVLSTCGAAALAVSTLAWMDVSAAAGELPRGSWTQSCSNASMSGPDLRATCSKIDGSSITTSRNVIECRKPVTLSNIDGQLTCDQTKLVLMPEGNWIINCRGSSMKGPVLQASCGKIDGAWATTSIDVRTCDTTINNINGILICD